MFKPYLAVKNAPFPLRRFDSGTSLDISKDGGAVAAASNAPVETPAASGVYYNELTAVEMGADHIAYFGSAGDARSDGFLVTEPALDSGVAQAGGAASITLRAGYGGTAGTNCMIEIVRGTGKDQQPRVGTAYDSGTKVLSVRPDWTVVPDATSVYLLTPLPKVNPMQLDGNFTALQYLSEFWDNAYRTGTFGTGSTTTVLVNDLSGLGSNALVDAVILCLDGSNERIMRAISGYVDGSGQITLAKPLPTAPTNGQRFAVFGYAG